MSTAAAREYFESQAKWDESHIQPTIEYLATYRDPHRVMEQLELDLGDASGIEDWKEQNADEIEEFGVSSEQAYAWWRDAYRAIARARLERAKRNPRARRNPQGDHYAKMIDALLAWERDEPHPHDKEILRPLLARYPEARKPKADRRFWLGELLEGIQDLIEADPEIGQRERADLEERLLYLGTEAPIYPQKWPDADTIKRRRLWNRNPDAPPRVTAAVRYGSMIDALGAWSRNDPPHPHDKELLRQLLAKVPEATRRGANRSDFTEELYGILEKWIKADVELDYLSREELLARIDDVFYPAPIKRNPGQVSPEVRQAALDKYEAFHRYKPTDIGDFPADFEIPTELVIAGDAKWVTYRSSKVDPATLRKPRNPVDYIHEHDAGVETCIPEDEAIELGLLEREFVEVPEEFAQAQALVLLGQNLGYMFKRNGTDIEARAEEPLPELYCTPDGKCLLVIQDKREVLAMMWGGGLGVFPRGIDG